MQDGANKWHNDRIRTCACKGETDGLKDLLEKLEPQRIGSGSVYKFEKFSAARGESLAKFLEQLVPHECL